MSAGATTKAGNGTLLVIAVGDLPIAGKAKKSVFGEEGGELTPLYHKPDRMANQTGEAGFGRCQYCNDRTPGFGELGYSQETLLLKILDNVLQATDIHACAIPEVLPLA